MRLFISYAHQDTAKVAQIAGLLANGGHAVFWDTALQTGHDWRDQLRAEIEAADGLVFIITPTSVTSNWCQFELAHAIQHGKTIVPILLEDAPLPAALADVQYADLRQITVDAVAKLLGNLSTFSPLAPDRAPTPTEPQGPPERARAMADRGGQALAVGQGTLYHADRGGRISVGIGAVGLVAVLLVVAAIVAILVLGDESTAESVNLAATRQEESRLNQTATATNWTQTPTITPTATHTATPTATPLEASVAVTGQVAVAVAQAQDDDALGRLQPLADVQIGHDITSFDEAQSIATLYGASYVVWAVPISDRTTQYGLYLSPQPNAVQDQQSHLRFVEKLPPSLTLILPNHAAADVLQPLVLGYQSLSQQYSVHALEQFAAAVEALPPDVDGATRAAAYFSRGLASYYNKMYTAARDDYTTAFNATTDDALQVVLLRNRAIAAYAEGDLDAARTDLNAVLARDPQSALAYLYLGAVEEASGDTNAAISAYSLAIQRDPTLALAYYLRGRRYFNADEFVLALDDANSAIGLDDTFAHAYTLRGITRFAQFEASVFDLYNLSPSQADDYDQMTADNDTDYARADALNAQFAAAYTARGDTMLAADDALSARQDYELALSFLTDIAPTYGPIYERYALANATLGHFDTAILAELLSINAMSNLVNMPVFALYADHYRAAATALQAGETESNLPLFGLQIWRYEGEAAQSVRATIASENESIAAYLILPDNTPVELPNPPVNIQADGETLLFVIKDTHQAWQTAPEIAPYTLAVEIGAAQGAADTMLSFGASLQGTLYGDLAAVYTFAGRAGEIVEVTYSTEGPPQPAFDFDSEATYGSPFGGPGHETFIVDGYTITETYWLDADSTYYLTLRQPDETLVTPFRLSLQQVVPVPLTFEGDVASATSSIEPLHAQWWVLMTENGAVVDVGVQTADERGVVVSVGYVDAEGVLVQTTNTTAITVGTEQPYLVKIHNPRSGAPITYTVTVTRQ